MPRRADHDHLGDDDLLLAIDSELPLRLQREAEAHVSACAACRARRDALAHAARDASALYRDDPECESRSTTHARARLEATLRADAGQRFWRFPTPPQWALAGAAIATAVLAVRLMSFSPSPLAIDASRDALPIASVTPGAVSNISADELCAGTRLTRPVSLEVQRQVLRDYHMESVPADQYELDYLITPELGGATDARNLWPQRYSARTWNAHVKDELERLLPQLVCTQQLDLAAAQRDMAANWIAAYRKYFKTDAPLGSHSSAREDDDGPVLEAERVPRHAREWMSPRVELISRR